MEGLVALVDLFLVGTYQYCDRSHASFPEYTPRLLSAPLVTVKTPDLTYTLPADRTTEFIISNFDLGNQTLTAPSISSILKAEKPVGKAVRLRYYDPAVAAVIFQLDGIIVEVADLNQRQARLLVQEVDADAFQKTLSIRVLDRFPSADLASTVTEDPVEIIPFGIMRRVDLTLCHRTVLSVSYVFANTMADNFRLDYMSNLTNYVLQPGDYLYYDVLWSTATAGIGIGLRTSVGVIVGNNGEVDQNGVSAIMGANLWPQMSVLHHHWYRRKIKILDGHIGQTVDLYFIGARGNAAGTYAGFLSNAFIGDTYGNIRKYLITAETGQPTMSLYLNTDPGGNGAPTVVFFPIYDYGPIRASTGSGLSFAGTGGMLIVPPSGAQLGFTVGAGCTFEGFLKTTSPGRVIGARVFTSGQGWQLFTSAAGMLSVTITPSGGAVQQVVSAAAVTDGAWHYFALTINNTTKIATLYLDVFSPVTVSYTGTFSDSGGFFSFGTVPAQTSFIGSLDDLRFWGKIRTTTELQHTNNRNMPYTGTEASLYGYWPFDELAGTPASVVRDWTGRGYNGTLSGATSVVTGAITPTRIVTVYRDGRVADEVDWQIGALVAYFAQFRVAQVDVNGRQMRIQADLFSLEFDQSFAAVEKFLLSDASYGLGLPVSSAAFTAAVTAYRTESYICGHGIFQAVSAREVFRYLHVRGSYLRRNTAVEYELIVDTAAAHTSTPASLGQADGYWENCEIRSQRILSLSQRVRKLTLQGVFDRGFSGGGSYLVNTDRSRVDKGREETLKNAFLGDSVTVDKECDYLFKALVSLDSQIEVQALSEFVGQEIRKLTSVFSPNMDFSGDQYQLQQWQLQGANLVIVLGQWDPLLLTYTVGKIIADARAASITDFSATFPGVPTGVSVVANGIRTGSNGATIEAFILATATMPSSNGTHIVFRALQPGSQVPQQEIIVAANAGQTKSAQFALPPGLIFDVHILIRNVDNPLLFRDGTVVVVSSVLTPGDTTIPPAPTGIVLRQSGTKEVEIIVVFAEPADWGVLELFRNSISATGGSHLESKRGKVFHDQGVNYGDVWYYSARARDYSNNFSAFSPVASISIGRLGGNDIGPNAINGTHIGSAVITGTHIGTATIGGVNIGAAAINGTHIGTGVINGTHIANATIGGINIGAAAIIGTHIGTAVITAGHLGSGIIGSVHVSAGAINTVAISANAITTITINGDAVTSAKRQQITSQAGIGSSGSINTGSNPVTFGFSTLSFSHGTGRFVTVVPEGSANWALWVEQSSTSTIISHAANLTAFTSGLTHNIQYW